MKHERISMRIVPLFVIIILAFIGSTILFAKLNTNLSKISVEQLTKLTAEHIAEDLTEQITLPEILAENFSHNEYLNSWAEQEGARRDDSVYLAQLTDLLSQNAYYKNCTLNTYASTITGRLYSSDGSWDYLSMDSREDAWFYDMLKDSGMNHQILYSFAPENQGILNLTTAHKIQDLNGKTVGIVRIHFTIDDLRGITNRFDVNTLDMESYLLDSSGNLLYASHLGAVSDYNIFRDGILRGYAPSATLTPKNLEGLWLGNNPLLFNSQQYCHSIYLPTLNCYLLVLDKNSAVQRSLNQQIISQLVILALVLTLLIILVANIIRKYQSQIIKDMDMDDLTGLPTRKAFSRWYSEVSSLTGFSSSSMFLLDIDHFKQVNDTYGHRGGDIALQTLSRILTEELGRESIVSRWGGDEFIGVIPQSSQNAKKLLNSVRQRLSATLCDDRFQITISAGIIALDSDLSLHRMAEAADHALYQAKEQGRNRIIVSNYQPSEPKPADILRMPALHSASKPPAAKITFQEFFQRNVTAGILSAIQHMIPFVAGGGILIALSFLMDALNYHVNDLHFANPSLFGSLTPISAALKDLGNATFQFMLPVFAGFFAYEMVGIDAFLAGFIGGYLMADCNMGFIGALLASAAAALICYEFKKFIQPLPSSARQIISLIGNPVFTLLLIRLITLYLITPAADAIGMALQDFLYTASGSAPVLSGAVTSGMMALDMGGIFNKAAYAFAAQSISVGRGDIMAAVMLGGMVPPIGVALCAFLFKGDFSSHEQKIAPLTFVMGLSFITEGVLPFVFIDLWRVILSSAMGSACAGALCILFECRLTSPHGGILVFPLVNQPIRYLLALMAGSCVTMLTLHALKKCRKPR